MSSTEDLYGTPAEIRWILKYSWKAGIVYWNRTQPFNAFEALLDTYLCLTDGRIWIGKSDTERKWEIVASPSNYRTAIAPEAIQLRIKRVSTAWMEIEDDDYEEDLSVSTYTNLIYLIG